MPKISFIIGLIVGMINLINAQISPMNNATKNNVFSAEKSITGPPLIGPPHGCPYIQ
jgi:hypothetical protein